jgi:hypothetical protein
MSSKDRRIVHLALKDHEAVTTESRGEDLRRKVVIVPKVKAEAVSTPAPALESVTPSEGEPIQAAIDGGNVNPPVEIVVPEAIDPGNRAPVDPVVEDNIGNR